MDEIIARLEVLVKQRSYICTLMLIHLRYCKHKRPVKVKRLYAVDWCNGTCAWGALSR